MKTLLNRIDNVRALQLFQVIRFGSLLLISIVIVKLGLSPAEIGHYETALFLANILTFFWVNGAIHALLPIFPANDPNKKQAEFFNVAIVFVAFSLVSGAFGFLFENLLRKTESISNYPLFSLALLYTVLNAIGFFNEYIYLLRQKPLQMLIYGVASFSIQVLCILIPAAANLGVEYMIWGLIAVSAFRILWLVRLVALHSQCKIKIQFIKTWMKNTIPLSLKFFIGGSGNFIDSIIITTFYSSSVFALYRYGAKDFPLTLLLANGLSTALLPMFGNQLDGALNELKARSKSLMNWLFPASIALLIVAKPLFIRVFSSDFEESAQIFMIYLLLISSRLLFPQTVAMGLGRNRVLLFISIIELATNVGLSLLWLKPYGLEGIAMATVVAFMLDKILIATYLHFSQGISPNRYTPLPTYFFWLLMLTLTYCFVRFVF
jgi:O-antigen/teichoic acid export membrane protein